MQIAPAPALRHLVKHFLVLENEGAAMLHHRLSPDGHGGIAFCYRSLFINHPRSFVYGQASRFHDLFSTGPIGMVVAVLQPDALHLLTGIPAHQFTDLLTGIATVFGKAGALLEEQVMQAGGHRRRIQLITSFLCRHRPPVAADPLVHAAVQACRQQGLASVTALAKELYTTERQLERKFRHHIGLSPKQFARTVRFQYLLKQLQQAPGAELTRQAYEAGYYDQSHFIREFRLLAGITPGQYTAQARLAINFMQLNLR